MEEVVDKTKPSLFVHQESDTPCTPALRHDCFIARELSELGSDDSLNQGNVSLLQRIDRLDNILSTMEEKAPTEPSGHSFRSPHGSRRISLTPSSLEKHCKSTESVLEEVEVKGTLVERVSELEKRLMKLQQIIATKASENVVYPGLVEVTTSAHSFPPHDAAVFHHHEHDDHEQSLQDLIDVEKHEVTTISSAPLEYDQHHEPFIYSEKIDTSPRKRESPLHMEAHQGMASSEGTSAEEDDPRADQHQSKKKSQRIKRWLSKRLHIGSSTPQGKYTCSTGQCWSSRPNPRSCWNPKRRELHASSTYTHYVQKSIDEDSP